MARKKTELPVLIRLHLGDRGKLEVFYPGQPYTGIVRKIVRKHLEKLETKLDAKTGTAPRVRERDFE